MTTTLHRRAATIAALFMPVAACGQASPASPTPHAQADSGGAGITFQQFEARRMGRLMALDTDGDGRISRAEFMAGATSGKGDPARRFARLDANGDGFVGRDEIDAMLRRRFDRMDSNGDGMLSPSERAAMHKDRATTDGNDRE